MPMTAGQLEQMIRTALPDAKVDITDLRGDRRQIYRPCGVKGFCRRNPRATAPNGLQRTGRRHGRYAARSGPANFRSR